VQHPVAATPLPETVTLMPQPSAAALSTSLPVSLNSQPHAVATTAPPARATTLPTDDAPRTAPPPPLTAPLPHLSDVLRKAKSRHAQATCQLRRRRPQQHPPFRSHHCSAHRRAFICPPHVRRCFTRNITHRPKISSVNIRRVYDPGGNSIGSNGDDSGVPLPATLWPVEERGSQRVSHGQPLALVHPASSSFLFPTTYSAHTTPSDRPRSPNRATNKPDFTSFAVPPTHPLPGATKTKRAHSRVICYPATPRLALLWWTQ
jgi:hypothetical protein